MLAHGVFDDFGEMGCAQPLERRALPRFKERGGREVGDVKPRGRIEAARRQLEETDDTVTVIAARCGFGTAETMRRNFVRRMGVSPDQYRKAFA